MITFHGNQTDLESALRSATHIGIGAHPDDLEIMALHGILQGYQNKKDSFVGIVLTDGAGGPRKGKYARMSKAEYVKVRQVEQKRAAAIGRYGAMIQLGYSSSELKGKKRQSAVKRLCKLLNFARPSVVYTHDLSDRHDTHVSTALLVIEALRKVTPRSRPKKIYGCEVWRSLDWLPTKRKVALDVTGGEALSRKLIRAFRSQVEGAKPYDVGVAGRQTANATFLDAHSLVDSKRAMLVMDLMPLLRRPWIDPNQFIDSIARELRTELRVRIENVTS